MFGVVRRYSFAALVGSATFGENLLGFIRIGIQTGAGVWNSTGHSTVYERELSARTDEAQRNFRQRQSARLQGTVGSNRKSKIKKSAERNEKRRRPR